jgi:hypothetical protein
MTADTAPSSFLDSMWLRLIAFFIAIGGVLLFIAVNQDFLTERLSGRSGGASSTYQQCVDERMAAVEELAREAGYTAKQKELAEIRAQEFCRNQTGM